MHDGSKADQIRISEGIVEFSNFSIFAGSIDFIGFNASQNANITALAVSQDLVVFNIDAVNGSNTETTIKAPPHTFDVDVDGEDSFSYNSTSQLVNVQESHGEDTKQIVVFFNRTTRIQNVSSIEHFHNASSIITVVGTLTDGNISSTQIQGDGNTYNVTEVIGVPGYNIEFNFTDVHSEATCIWVSSFHLYSGNNNDDIHIEFYNWTASAWVQIDVIDDDTVFEWHNVTHFDLRIPDPQAFISMDNTVRARFIQVDTGVPAHDIRIDKLQLIMEIPTDIEAVTDVDIFPWIAIAIILSIIAYLLARGL